MTFIHPIFQGFIPRGKHTLTSRLFVLEKFKQELDRQLAAARIINKNKISSINKLPNNQYDASGDDDDDYLSEEDLNPQNFIEDFVNNPDECAFPSSRQTRCLTNREVFRLMNNRSDLLKTSRTIERNLFKPNEQMCTSIDLSKSKRRSILSLGETSLPSDRNYEVYFQSNNPSKPNLLTIDHLRSLCRKQKELIDLFQVHSTCHFTLPEMVAYFVNKSDCQQLVEKDIPIFIERIQRCHALYDTGLIRLAGLKRYRTKPLELFQYDTCFRHNFTFLTLEYLVDKTFLKTNETFYTGMWFLRPTNPMKTANGIELHTTDTAYDIFIEHFNENPKFDDEWTRIAALNFLDIRIPTAMKQIRVDMSFVILAISLIIAVSFLCSNKVPLFLFR